MIILPLCKLLLSVTLVFFIPGWLTLLVVLRREREHISLFEQFVLSFGLSITVVDFLMIAMNLAHMALTRWSLVLAIGIYSFFFLLLYFDRKKKPLLHHHFPSFFSYRSLLIFLVLFIFSLVIRTIYVGQGALPQTTDLGHHSYWAKYITIKQSLPTYDDIVINPEDQGKFIIGEHLTIAAVGTISGLDYVSAFPVIILFIVNIFSLLALVILANVLTRQLLPNSYGHKSAALVMLTIGIFYALSSPQAVYVSGGVIGNLYGNLLVPLLFYTLIQAISHNNYLKDRNASPFASKMAALAVIFGATLAYTHHLSTFILLFVLVGLLLIFVVTLFIRYRANLKLISQLFLNYLKLFFHWRILLLLTGFITLLFVYPPSYLNRSSIDTAVGKPTKETRIGLEWDSIAATTGNWRFNLSWLAIGVILFWMAKSFKEPDHTQQHRNNQLFAFSLLASWFLMIFLMANKPNWLEVDIPSARIANYLTLPAAVLSAIMLLLFSRATDKKKHLLSMLLFMVFVFSGFAYGLANISEQARPERKFNAVSQLYDASNYLKEKTKPEDIILKDHINLVADSWVKVLLMRGYLNPLSRSFLRRYEDTTKQRETCTRDMIAIPDESVGQQCFLDTKTRFIMLKPGFDTNQFEKSTNFSKLFTSENVVIYEKY